MPKCLLLCDSGGRLPALAPALERAGCDVARADGEAESFCAREADGLALIGAGEGCWRALLLAERYPVERLALIGCPLRPRASSPLRRRAERDLFSVVCDLLIVQPLSDASMLPRGADVLLRCVHSRERRRVDMGGDFADLWTEHEQWLTRELLRFLGGEYNAKTLAK